jgi:hypothetical protein
VIFIIDSFCDIISDTSEELDLIGRPELTKGTD